MDALLQASITQIGQYLPSADSLRIGLVLGSGQGRVVDSLDVLQTIAYEDLPCMPACSVAGHAGLLHIARCGESVVFVLQGRPHWYEGVDGSAFIAPKQLLKQLGCEHVIMTNASGCLRKEWGVSQLVLVSDHINIQGRNPLVGMDIALDERFVGLEHAYDKTLGEALLKSAESLGYSLPEGVYASTLGPCFETPAEIRAMRLLGADLVGMSTVPDVIAARYVGLKVGVVAAIVNQAAGQSEQLLSHDLTLKGAKLAEDKLSALLTCFFESYHTWAEMQRGA